MDFKKAIGLALLLALFGLQSVASAERPAASAPAASPTATAAKPDALPEDPVLVLSEGDSAFVKESLDQKKIHALYNNGDFEPVIAVLEGFIKRNKTYSHSDSVFISKHLAVVYSANPNSRERGRYFMYRLLELLPSAKLVDMYVSEEVDRIFDKVRDEFMARQKGFGVDTAGIVLPERPGHDRIDSTPSGRHGKEPEEKTGGKGRWTAWALGGTTLIAIGAATAYYLTLEDPEDKIYKIP